MKFLKTIRFDSSDTHVFESAAAPDEWAVPGGLAFADDREDSLTGKRKQAFSNGFLSLVDFGYSTFVSVAEIDQTTIDDQVEGLATHFVSHFGAPSADAARPAAQAEINFVLDMCAGTPLNSVFTLRRFFDDDGEMREEFRIVDAPGAKPHTRVWEVVED